jgi:hypothetical protein
LKKSPLALAHPIIKLWPQTQGKIHVICGCADTFRLEEVAAKPADYTMVEMINNSDYRFLLSEIREKRAAKKEGDE